MADIIAWKNFRRIIGIINQLENNIKQIVENTVQLEAMKEEILDDPVLRAALKEVIDVYPNATIQSLGDDYNKFKALKEWLEQNGYI